MQVPWRIGVSPRELISILTSFDIVELAIFFTQRIGGDLSATTALPRPRLSSSKLLGACRYTPSAFTSNGPAGPEIAPKTRPVHASPARPTQHKPSRHNFSGRSEWDKRLVQPPKIKFSPFPLRPLFPVLRFETWEIEEGKNLDQAPSIYRQDNKSLRQHFSVRAWKHSRIPVLHCLAPCAMTVRFPA